MINTALLIQSLISGVLMGGIYALMGVGFSLTWGVLRVINIAHASFGVLAAYGAYWALNLFRLDPIISIFPIVPILFLMGMGLYRFLIRPITMAKETIVASMVLTFGIAIIVENTMLILWSPNPRALTPSYAGRAFFIGQIGIPVPQLLGFLIAILGISIIYLFIHRTYTGKAVQATWQEPEGAALVGIDIQKVSMIAFGIAISTAGCGGVAMAMMYTFDPAMHNIWLIFMFLIVIFGGVGSIMGTALSGIFIGVITGLCLAFFPYQWINVITFGLLIIILLLRPQGIFRTGA